MFRSYVHTITNLTGIEIDVTFERGKTMHELTLSRCADNRKLESIFVKATIY